MRTLSPRPKKLKAYLFNTLCLLALLMNLYPASAQPADDCFVNPRITKIFADVSPTIKSYMEYKPVDYNTNPTKRYPLLIYIGGTGEMFQQPSGTQDSLCRVLNYSLPWRANVFHMPDYVTDPNTNQQYSYFMVMPFVRYWEEQYNIDPGAMIDYMLANYPNRIDPSRIYLTAMSRGTDNIMGYVAYNANSARRIAAMVVVANCFPSNVGSPTYNEQVSNIANSNLKLWGISCSGDIPCTETYMQNWVNSVNGIRPGNAVFTYATFACDDQPGGSRHYAWNHAYDPDYRPAPVNKNVYEWMIQFSQNALVPVRLKDWTARVDRGKVLLQWTTSEELLTKEFVIQRATPTGQFQDLYTVPAAISSSVEKNYSVTDDRPLAGQSLYRLVLRNQDGKEEFFPIKRITIPGKWIENVIIPNPIQDGTLSVYLNIQRAQKVFFRLIDMNGRVLREENQSMSIGISEKTINVGSLQKGMYIMQVNAEDFKITKKITIE